MDPVWLQVEEARLRPRDGETIREYMQRQHSGGNCHCPRAYSRCKYAVIYDAFKGDRTHGHGGWGWPNYGAMK